MESQHSGRLSQDSEKFKPSPGNLAQIFLLLSFRAGDRAQEGDPGFNPQATTKRRLKRRERKRRTKIKKKDEEEEKEEEIEEEKEEEEKEVKGKRKNGGRAEKSIIRGLRCSHGRAEVPRSSPELCAPVQLPGSQPSSHLTIRAGLCFGLETEALLPWETSVPALTASKGWDEIQLC